MQDNILKVLHDSRIVDDILYNIFGCDIKNIFDTQVADFYVSSKFHIKFPRYFVTLSEALSKHLDLPQNIVGMVYKREYDEKEHDASVWKKRPLPKYLCDHLVDRVKYLLPLRKHLMELMLRNISIGSELYCDSDLHSSTSHEKIDKKALLNSKGLQDEIKKRLDLEIQSELEKIFQERKKNQSGGPFVWSRDIWHLDTNRPLHLKK